MTDQEIIEKVNKILGKVAHFFDSVSVIPESYRLVKEQEQFDDDEHFYRNLWLKDKNHQYKPNQNMMSFDAEEINKWRIPIYVVGCSGRAKLFAWYAEQKGLKGRVFIVPCVKLSDIGKKNMRGHQIIAVKMSNGHLQLINPNKSSFSEGRINEKFEIGKDIDALNKGKPEFRIVAKLTPEQHDAIDSPEKLQQLYAMKRSKFNSATHNIKTTTLRDAYLSNQQQND